MDQLLSVFEGDIQTILEFGLDYSLAAEPGMQDCPWALFGDLHEYRISGQVDPLHWIIRGDTPLKVLHLTRQVLMANHMQAVEILISEAAKLLIEHELTELRGQVRHRHGKEGPNERSC